MDDIGDNFRQDQLENRLHEVLDGILARNNVNTDIDNESDTDLDDSELSTIDEVDESFESSDTSGDEDDMWYGNLSTASSESSLASLADEGGNGSFFDLMNQHLEIFNHEADSFFRVSLRTLYETLMEFMEEKGGPTPNHILQSLPLVKVTLAQIAANATCPICFAEYEQDEELIKLPCQHDYHKDCIHNWLKRKSTCPTCRLDLAKSAETQRREESIENIDITDIDSLLADDISEEADSNSVTNTDTTENRNDTGNSHTSSSTRLDSHHSLHGLEQEHTQNIHPIETDSSSTHSLSSGSSQINTNKSSVQTLRVFSRSSSPILIDSSEDTDTSSPFSSKVSIVEAVNSNTPNGGSASSSVNHNKRQTDTTTAVAVPAKRKIKETEIW